MPVYILCHCVCVLPLKQNNLRSEYGPQHRTGGDASEAPEAEAELVEDLGATELLEHVDRVHCE
jgi:hypothetical protein